MTQGAAALLPEPFEVDPAAVERDAAAARAAASAPRRRLAWRRDLDFEDAASPAEAEGAAGEEPVGTLRA